MGLTTQFKHAMHGWCKVHVIRMWGTRSHSPSHIMRVAHVNGHGNLCKHHAVVLLHVLISHQKWLFIIVGDGFNYNGFEATFTNLTYLHLYDNKFNDEETKANHTKYPWVVNMGGLVTQDDTPTLNVGEKSNINLSSNLKTPIERTFMHINVVMQVILDEVKKTIFNALTMPCHCCVWFPQMSKVLTFPRQTKQCI